MSEDGIVEVAINEAIALRETAEHGAIEWAHRILTARMPNGLSAAERNALRERLGREMLLRLKQGEAPGPASSPSVDQQEAVMPAPPRFDFTLVETWVADAMRAATDGSAERFKVLADRAWGRIAAELVRCRSGLFTKARAWLHMKEMLRRWEPSMLRAKCDGKEGER